MERNIAGTKKRPDGLTIAGANCPHGVATAEAVHELPN